MKYILCYFNTFILILSILKPVQLDEFIVIDIPDGKIQGIKSVTEQNNIFYAFRGLRYAQPPVGNLRFRAPLPVVPWTDVYNATYKRDNCVQYPATDDKTLGYEDCLFLDVFTPHLNIDDNDKTFLPVVVYVHGGAFFSANNNINLHEVDKYLDRGVIFVFVNFRLGLFGFLCTEDENCPGNYALKDQILALKWVQKNIAAFGGDARKVTIFGHSSGAICVQYLRQAKNAKNLFHQVIANSGTSLNVWGYNTNPRQIAFLIGLANGIITNNTKTLIEKLRAVNVERLRLPNIAANYAGFLNPLNSIPFAPCFEKDSDEAVFSEYSYEAQKQGHFNFGNILLGFSSLEGRIYANVSEKIVNLFYFLPGMLVPQSINTSECGKKIMGQNILSQYFQNNNESKVTNFIKYVSDNNFVRAILKSAELQMYYTNVYLYKFSFIGGRNHISHIPEGVEHAGDYEFFFNKTKFVQTTDAAILVQNRLIEMWCNFIKTGNPTPKPTALVNVTWPLINATGYNTIHYIEIGNNLTLEQDPQKENMKFWDEQFEKHAIPPYNTY